MAAACVKPSSKQWQGTLARLHLTLADSQEAGEAGAPLGKPLPSLLSQSLLLPHPTLWELPIF